MKQTAVAERLSVFFLGLLLTAGCAKELSKEQLERETRDRVVDRVSGSKGYFVGSIEQGSQVVPLELSVDVRTTSGTDVSPAVTMKTGLFGGVVVSASSATYDAGRNELIARFSKGAKVTLELKGIISEKGFEGTLVGDTSRNQKVHLRKNSSSPASLRDNVLVYRMTYKNRAGKPFPHLPSVMTLRLNLESTKAPDSFDLDQMPSMSMAFRFQGTSRVPNLSTRVSYDPLVSLMEVALSDRVVIRFRNLGFQEGNIPSDLVPEKMVGTIYQDSVEVGIVEGVRISSLPPEDWAPPSNYTGCLTMPAAGLVYPVTARLTDLNVDLANPSSILFPKAPAYNLDLTVLTTDGTAYGRMALILVESDPITSRLLFRQTRGSSIVNLEMLIGKNQVGEPWAGLTGSMQTPRSRVGSSQTPKLSLTPGMVMGQVPSCGASAKR